MNEIDMRFVPKNIKTDDEIIAKIIELRKTKTLQELANIFSLSKATVWKFCKGITMETGIVYRVDNKRYLQIIEIRQRYLAGEKYYDIHKDYPNFSGSHFNQIIKNTIYHDNNYNPPKRINFNKCNFTEDDIISIRKRYNDGEDVYSIAVDFKDVVKQNIVMVIRKIINRESFKKI